MFHSFLRIWGVLCARNQGIVTVWVSNSGPYGTDRWHIRASPAGVGSALPGPLAQTATTRGWFFSVAEVLVLEASGSSSRAISSALLPSILSTPSDNGFPELIGGKVQQMLWETGGLPRPQAMPQNGGTLGIPQVPGVLAHNCILQNLPSPQPLPAAWLLDDSAMCGVQEPGPLASLWDNSGGLSQLPSSPQIRQSLQGNFFTVLCLLPSIPTSITHSQGLFLRVLPTNPPASKSQSLFPGSLT